MTIPQSTNRKIRALLKEGGYTYDEIAKDCRVCAASVRKQAIMLAALGVKLDKSDASFRSASTNAEKNGTAPQRKVGLARGYDMDDSGIDLVTIFNTPRSRKEIRRYQGEE